MLSPMTGLGPRILGFEAAGRLSAEDYETVLIPTADAALKQDRPLRLLFLAGARFEGFEPGAFWQDALFGFHHFFDFERIAVVTDRHDLAAMATAFGTFMPAAVRSFPVAALDAAKAWLAEGRQRSDMPGGGEIPS